MAILAADSGGYQSIPAQDEDVTPVDRTITSRSQKAFRYVLIASCAIIVAVVGIVSWYQYKERLEVSVYETAMSNVIGMRQLTIKDMTSSTFNPATLTFGNVHCDGDSDAMLCTNMPPSPARIAISRENKLQTILGFGGAFTEASAINFYALPPQVRERVLELYFGDSGIGYSLGRIHINSCDYSLSSYSFDDVAGDVELHHFDKDVTHDQEKILPFIHAAMQRSPRRIRLLASPWSPPAWMKAADAKGKHSMTGSAVPNGLQDDPSIKQAWAQYISKFISAYSAQGVPIWAITPQNEPEFAAPWEACAYTASAEKDFIQDYLGPVLHQEHPEVLILGFDHNKDHLEQWAQELMTPDGFVDGMAFHWYSGGDRVEDGTYGYDAVNATHHLAPEGVLLASEGCSCPGVDLGNWLRAERLGHDVLYDLLNHAQGWIDWNLLLDRQGGPNHLGNNCDAALVVDEDTTDILVQPKFHYMTHFSKFVPPGAVRVGTSAVGDYAFAAVDPNIQAGVEVGMFVCERSVRQTWRLTASTTSITSTTTAQESEALVGEAGRLQLATRVLTQDVSFEGTVQLCVAQSARLPARTALRLADCTDSRAAFLQLAQNSMGQLVDTNSSQCLSFIGDVREPGALLELAPCATFTTRDVIAESTEETSSTRTVNHQLFAIDLNTGEITAPKVDRNLCLTAGWPFFNAVAFKYPEELPHGLSTRMKTSVVVMNEAAVPTPVTLWDKERDEYLGLVINARAIQTIVF